MAEDMLLFPIESLPEKLLSLLDSHSYEEKNKITEFVLDVSRKPHFWAEETRMLFSEKVAELLVEPSDLE